MNHIFIFGNTPKLSQLELDSIYQGGGPLEIAGKLGGTVKIAERIGDISEISNYLISQNLPKIDFGISGKPELSKQVKRELEEVGIKARFVLPREGSELSSVVVKKQKLVELIVEGDTFGRTIWVQDFEEWNRRDFGRPAADPKSGMLPPKVARMMVNIATSNKQQAIILDPFCGVGTILAEGLMVGTSVIGSDISSNQVEKTKQNLEWLKRDFRISGLEFRVLQSDSRNVSSKITEKIDAVVTEPDLGHSTDANLREKLGYMYISSLEDWKKILKPGGKVIMVIPSFTISKAKELDLVKMVLDRAKIMGYSEFHSPIEYFRKQAIIKRNICFLEFRN